MSATPLTPQLTIEWFERLDQDHEALCLFLTANPAHRNILTTFLRNQMVVETTLGRNIGFIVSDSESSASHEITTDRGRQFILPGEAINLQPLHSVIPSTSDGDSSPGPGKDPIEIQSSAELIAKSHQEWLDVFSIQKTQLPVLCVLIKGCDPVSICLNNDLSLSRLPGLLGEISEIADHNSRIDPHTIPNFNRKLAKYTQLSERLVEKEKELKGLFDTLAKISGASNEDRAKATEHLSSKKFSPDEMKQLLKGLDFYLSPEFKHRKTITGVMNKSRAIEKLLAELDEQTPSQSECESINATVERISERRSKVRILLERLAKDNHHPSTVDRNQITRQHDAFSIRLDAASNAEEVISSMRSKCKGRNLLVAKLTSFAGSGAVQSERDPAHTRP